MEPIRHEEEIQTYTKNEPILTEIQGTNPRFHVMKF
jgi:hypothetical protein